MLKLFTLLLSILCLVLAIGLAACYFDRGWLTIASAANLFSIFASIAVVVSLLFIAFQARQQTRMARAANSQSFVNVASNFLLAMGTDSKLMEFYLKASDEYETLGRPEQNRYEYLIAWWLMFYENVQYQQDCKLLDKSVYDAWMKDMKGFAKRRRVDKVWEELKVGYSDNFIATFDPIIKGIKPDQPAQPEQTKTITVENEQKKPGKLRHYRISRVRFK